MEKFLRELDKATAHIQDSTSLGAEAQAEYSRIADKYSKYIGHKALYKSKSMREYRVVTIEEIGDRYITVYYTYHGKGYSGKIRTCINYPSLISEDDVLEVEDIV